MKIKEIRSMGIEELTPKLEELRKELMKVNTQIASGTVPNNPGSAGQIKKNIARILTIIHEKKKKENRKEIEQLRKNPEVADKR